MSLIFKFIAARRQIAAVALAALLPLGFALTGCGDAPKLSKPPAPESNTRDGEPMGSPKPDVSEAPVDEPAGAPPPAAEEKSLEQERSRADQDERQKQETAEASKDGAGPSSPSRGLEKPGAGAGGIGAAPPPSPAPSAAPPPKMAQPPAGGAAPPTMGSGPPAAPPPPVTAADVKKPFDVIQVFYGTDRAVEPDPKRLQFGAERGRKLQIGQALVTVPTAHKVPNIERPWVVELPYFKYKIYEETEDPNKHFTMQEVSALTKEQMLAAIKARLAKSSSFKDHAFVFVHGFNTSFDNAIYRTAQITNDLNFDGAPFVYSWPSGGKVASYTYDRGSAEQSEPQLAEFLQLVVEQSGAKSISLIAHSMGNELLMRVLERMRPKVPKGVVISQVILAAPDVDRDKFDNIAREITSFAQGVTLYAASNDKALGYSARFWGGVPRAGDVPAAGPLIIPGVDTIDVTALSTDSLALNHSGYAENTTLLNDIKLLIQTGERPPDKRIPILQPVKTAAGGLYWRYPPVR
jgi:esterase/lipase superfamily enzyme